MSETATNSTVKNKKYTCGTPKGYIGMSDVCRLFGKSRKTIYNMIGDGRLPKPLRFGSLLVWDEKDVQNWLKNAKFCKRWK